VEVLGALSFHRQIVDPSTPVAAHKSFCDLFSLRNLSAITVRNLLMLSAYNNRLSFPMFLLIAFTQKYHLRNVEILSSMIAQTQPKVNEVKPVKAEASHGTYARKPKPTLPRTDKTRARQRKHGGKGKGDR
jgi:hypothetical protein